MSLVNGKDVDLYLFNSGVWKLCACARSVSLNTVKEFIETSVSGNGVWASFLPAKSSFTGTLDGVVSLNETGMLGLPDLRQKQSDGAALLFRFQRIDADGHIYTDQGTIYISSISDVCSFDNVAVFNVGFQGSGLLTLDFAPIVPVPIGGVLVNRYEWTAAGGELGFTDSSLINKYILEVNTDGKGDGKILFGGIPVGDDVLYNILTGAFTWAIPFEAGEEVYILYQDI